LCPAHSRYPAPPSQSGLGLPSPEYYKKNPGDDPYLRAYSTYLDRLLALAAADGALPPPAAAAAAHPARRAGMVRAALAFETELAAAFVPKAELREPQAYYEPVPSLGELQRLTDGRAGQRLFRWQAFVDAYYAGDATEGGGVPQGGSGTPGVGSPPSPLVLSGSRYLSRAFSSVVHGTNVSTVQVYLQLQVLQEYARHLSDAYVQATFELNKASACKRHPDRARPSLTLHSLCSL
jgi:predicted metalloendopeptidase